MNNHYSRLLPVLGLGNKFRFDKDMSRCLCPSAEALKDSIDRLLDGWRAILELGSKLKGNFLASSVTLSSSSSCVMIKTELSKDTENRYRSRYWEFCE